MRSGSSERATSEVEVATVLELDGTGKREIETGVRMLDHLLQQFAFHAGCDLYLRARSLDGIEHHLVEDVAIALGAALRAALGERRGIERFGSALVPMDDALVRAAVDLGGRGYARCELHLDCERVEDLSAEMLPHFFASLASGAGIAVHIDALAGSNAHHRVEAAFKALGRACSSAWRVRSDSHSVPSTKGVT